MANTNTGFLNADQLDFVALKSNFKQWLSQQDQFKDYDFDGSNLSVLLDLLTYNTYINAFYLNMVGSEMFLDTAILRPSIVSHAKELNYTPQSMTSAMAYVDLKLIGNNLPSVVTIPANFQIVGQAANGQSFTFLTSDAINIGAANNWVGTAIPFYEGKIVTETFVANSSVRYTLQSANVDVTSIKVNVQNSSSDTTNSNWTKAETLFGYTGTSNVFFVQGYQDYLYEVTFGSGVVGAPVPDGSIVRVTYRQTNGPLANGVKKFVVNTSLANVQSITATISNTNVMASGGSLAESNSSIQFNAPKYFATQERAITEEDYQTLLENKFPLLQAVTAYGGEKATPPMYGKVLISAKPFSGTVLPNTLKEQMVTYLQNKCGLTTTPIYQDPAFFYVGVNSKVYYNLNVTTLSDSDIESAVANEIVNWGNTALAGFGGDLAFSKLSAAIDSSDESVVRNDTSVQMIYKLNPLLGITSSYTWSFGNQIYTDSPTLYAYPAGRAPAVTSGAFGYTKGGTSYNSFIQDDGLGKLYIYTTDNQGNKVILNSAIGTVSYATGAVSINNLIVDSLPTGVSTLNIYARLITNDISTSTNQVLVIDPLDVTVDAIGVRL
jgi:hypothetical protein